LQIHDFQQGAEKQLQQIIKAKATAEGIERNQLKQAQTNLMTLNGVAQPNAAMGGIRWT
jgi:hypothetical protein